MLAGVSEWNEEEGRAQRDKPLDGSKLGLVPGLGSGVSTQTRTWAHGAFSAIAERLVRDSMPRVIAIFKHQNINTGGVSACARAFQFGQKSFDSIRFDSAI